MALLRIKQLGSHHVAAGGVAETVYQVPAGHRATVRDVRIANPSSASAVTTIIDIVHSGDAFAHQLFNGSLALNATAFVQGQIVLEELDLLRVFTNGAGVTVLASGAELPISP